eukprot:684712-Pelagomonas_calceolata.AAC.2
MGVPVVTTSIPATLVSTAPCPLYCKKADSSTLERNTPPAKSNLGLARRLDRGPAQFMRRLFANRYAHELRRGCFVAACALRQPHLDQLHSRSGKVGRGACLVGLHDRQPLAPRAVVAGNGGPAWAPRFFKAKHSEASVSLVQHWQGLLPEQMQLETGERRNGALNVGHENPSYRAAMYKGINPLEWIKHEHSQELAANTYGSCKCKRKLLGMEFVRLPSRKLSGLG